IPPPRVHVLRPDPYGRVGAVAEVVAEVTPAAGNPVGAIALYVDKTLVDTRAGRPGSGPQTVTWTVPLSPGPHTIRVEARGEKSDGLSEPMTVVRPGARAAMPKLFILSVGVSNLSPELDPNRKWRLPNAAADAEAVADTFRRSCSRAYD